MNKTTKISFILAIIIGFPGSLIWAIVFWNNPEMFIHHWTVGFIAMGIASIPLILLLLKTN